MGDFSYLTLAPKTAEEETAFRKSELRRLIDESDVILLAAKNGDRSAEIVHRAERQNAHISDFNTNTYLIPKIEPADNEERTLSSLLDDRVTYLSRLIAEDFDAVVRSPIAAGFSALGRSLSDAPANVIAGANKIGDLAAKATGGIKEFIERNKALVIVLAIAVVFASLAYVVFKL